MLESFLTSQGKKLTKTKQRRGSIKKIKNKNIGTEYQGGYVQRPYGEVDQDRCEDDGTDRKKKEGRKGGKEGRTKESNQQQNLCDRAWLLILSRKKKYNVTPHFDCCF